MDDITRLLLGSSIRGAQPVEPLRKTQPPGDGRRRPQEGTRISARTEAAESGAERETDRKEIERQAAQANRVLEWMNTSVRFAVHEATERIQVKLIREDTGELIREFPPSELLNMSAKLQEVFEEALAAGGNSGRQIAGFFVDSKG